MPLLEQEVRGAKLLEQFSENLVKGENESE
jgi:hypothetical protein